MTNKILNLTLIKNIWSEKKFNVKKIYMHGEFIRRSYRQQNLQKMISKC